MIVASVIGGVATILMALMMGLYGFRSHLSVDDRMIADLSRQLRDAIPARHRTVVLPQDSFSRTVTDGWGTADVGRNWTVRRGVGESGGRRGMVDLGPAPDWVDGTDSQGRTVYAWYKPELRRIVVPQECEQDDLEWLDAQAAAAGAFIIRSNKPGELL